MCSQSIFARLIARVVRHLKRTGNPTFWFVIQTEPFSGTTFREDFPHMGNISSHFLLSPQDRKCKEVSLAGHRWEKRKTLPCTIQNVKDLNKEQKAARFPREGDNPNCKDLSKDGFPEDMTTPVPHEVHVLVGVTGSVAALKLPLLVSALLQIPGVQVQVVTTEKAKHFYNVKDISIPIYSDDDEWKMWTKRSDPVLHIELRRWADVMLIAPLDANTLGKIYSGICDNLLTCVVRAWDITKPLLFCPAMNTAMWNHPITAQQIKELLHFGYTEIPCIEKTLVCGDRGLGAMAEVDTIIDKVREVLSKYQLQG